MEGILKIRDYQPQPDKPDIDDLIYGDDHHVSEKYDQLVRTSEISTQRGVVFFYPKQRHRTKKLPPFLYDR